MESAKHFARSKTLWAAVFILAVQITFPSTKPWIKQHTEELIPMLGILFAGLRLQTSAALRIRRLNETPCSCSCRNSCRMLDT